jgi:primosomal protein N'
MLLAEVALADATRSYDRLYDYIVAADNDEDIVPGVRVLVPFGIKNKLKPAWIINIRTDEPTKKLKLIGLLRRLKRKGLISGEVRSLSI